MSDVPQNRVDEHESCFKDVEEPLIPQNRTQSIKITVFRFRDPALFYSAVDAPYED